MAKIKKNGIFFTFISLTIMAILIIVYTPQADITIQKDTKAEKVRIDSINNYINDLENEFMITVMKATAQKTLTSLIDCTGITHSPVKDFDAAFAEVMLKGTINNVAIDSITGKKIMENNTLSNWTLRFIEAGKDTYNVNTSITVYNATANQTTPWDVDIILKISIDVKSNLDKNFRCGVQPMEYHSCKGTSQKRHLCALAELRQPKFHYEIQQFNNKL